MSAEETLVKRWARVEAYLKAAIAAFGDAPRVSVVGLIAKAEEYLEHNELYLAWDTLRDAARLVDGGVPAPFQACMDAAQAVMETKD